MILGGMVLHIARAQEIKPTIALNGQALMEKTICFQLSPQETKFDFRIPEDAHSVYSKINWTGGAPALHVALLANELRRPKAQWEGNSPLEREFKLDGEITGEWYLKITNPSTLKPAFGCCTFYYTRKVEVKRGFSFDGANINQDTNKITYAEFIGIDRSTWGTGTFQITPEGEMGISYENGNYLKYMGAKGMLIKRGDSSFLVPRRPYYWGIPDSLPSNSNVAIQTPDGNIPVAPTKFASTEDQEWYFLLCKWVDDLNKELSDLPPFLFKAFKLKLEYESQYTSVLNYQMENKGIFSTHQFLINLIDHILGEAISVDGKKKPEK